MKKKNKVVAVVLCALVGAVGIHWVYLGETHRAKKRFLWFFFCNPVAFYNTLLDLGKIGLMSQYEFNSKYCNPKIEGTGEPLELLRHLEKIRPDSEILILFGTLFLH